MSVLYTATYNTRKIQNYVIPRDLDYDVHDALTMMFMMLLYSMYYNIISFFWKLYITRCTATKHSKIFIFFGQINEKQLCK